MDHSPPKRRALETRSIGCNDQPSADGSALAQLPFELLQLIGSNVEYPRDLQALASCSKSLYSALRLSAVLAQLESLGVGRTQRLCDYGLQALPLFCLSNSKRGEVGSSPFFLIAHPVPFWTDYHAGPGALTRLRVKIISPVFEHYDEEQPTEEYLFVRQTTERVWLDPRYFGDQYTNDVMDDLLVETDWDSEISGKLVRATGALLRERFECPECLGASKIRAGTRDVARRWPLLRYDFYRLGHTILPCPRCTITLDDAEELLYPSDNESSPSLFTGLWNVLVSALDAGKQHEAALVKAEEEEFERERLEHEAEEAYPWFEPSIRLDKVWGTIA